MRNVTLMNTKILFARFGDFGTVRRVLSESPNIADIPYYKETPLACAVRYGHLEIVRYLVLEAKCSVHDGCNIADQPSTDSAVHLACIAGD